MFPKYVVKNVQGKVWFRDFSFLQMYIFRQVKFLLDTHLYTIHKN